MVDSALRPQPKSEIKITKQNKHHSLEPVLMFAQDCLNGFGWLGGWRTGLEVSGYELAG